MEPVRSGTPYLPWDDPCEATRLLRYASPRQGFAHTHQSDGKGASLLSVLTEPTAWRKDGSLIRHEGSAPVRRRASGPAHAADHVTAGHRYPEPSREGHSPTDSVRESTA